MTTLPSKVEQSTLATFAQDVDRGLSSSPKKLSSKYLYDQEGSILFRKITALPEYYLTTAEKEILREQTREISQLIKGDNSFFHLIELGPGDGHKTEVLLNFLLKENSAFTYAPIDISGSELKHLQEKLVHKYPDLNIHAIIGEYQESLAWYPCKKGERKVLCFFGSNLGNFEQSKGEELLRFFAEQLNPGDLILMGLDLRKDIDVLTKAYNDSQQTTAAFNLNLLERINRELDANFARENFQHYGPYDPIKGAMKSYLVAKTQQEVAIGATGKTYHFEQGEAIDMESSQKYRVSDLDKLASNAKAKVVHNFFDKKNRYTISVWQRSGD